MNSHLISPCWILILIEVLDFNDHKNVITWILLWWFFFCILFYKAPILSLTALSLQGALLHWGLVTWSSLEMTSLGDLSWKNQDINANSERMFNPQKIKMLPLCFLQHFWAHTLKNLQSSLAVLCLHFDKNTWSYRRNGCLITLRGPTANKQNSLRKVQGILFWKPTFRKPAGSTQLCLTETLIRELL